jgi:GxxExxY protein
MGYRPTNSANLLMAELLFSELSYKLNGIFFEVQNKLGTKFQEKHYLRAVCAILEQLRITFETEVHFKIKFSGVLLGSFRADLIVDNMILIEMKTVDRLTVDHKKQMIRYLDALELPLGILVNFRNRPLQTIRVTKSKTH